MAHRVAAHTDSDPFGVVSSATLTTSAAALIGGGVGMTQLLTLVEIGVAHIAIAAGARIACFSFAWVHAAGRSVGSYHSASLAFGARTHCQQWTFEGLFADRDSLDG